MRQKGSPMIVGYARVSSLGQSLDVQLAALKAAGAERIFSEKQSGTQASNRLALQDALDLVREGDTLLCVRLDRLARSVADLLTICERLVAKGVAFRCTDQSGIDITSSSGKLMLTILGAVASFENDIRRERQRDGIEAGKLAGVYKGGKVRIDVAKVRALHADGLGPSEIASLMKIGRASVYRLLGDGAKVAAG
jgi:DNA invertase Pin-like site-specific DNA recombinase